MFKLPVLQPHLTGTGGVEGRRRSLTGYNPFSNTFNGSRREGIESAPTGTGTGPIELKSWEAQARDVTYDIASSDKYKSLVLHAEVKLAEALERCKRVQPAALASTGDEKPNRLKTAVCCQLLGEFAELCGPFSNVLKSLRDELLKSVYSGYYTSERGLLVFDQLTWFAVADRLEKEKGVMLEEREKFQQQLAGQQECVARIEDQLASYQRAMSAAQLEAASMKSKMENLVAMHDAAKLEAKTGREELKRARKEWLRMKDELDAEREAHKVLKTLHDISVADSKVLNTSHEHLLHKLADTQRQLELRLPADAIQGMEEKLQAATEQLKEATTKVAELECRVQQLSTEAGAMTPRPKLTQQLMVHGLQDGKSTQDLLNRAAEKLDGYLSDNVSTSEQLQEAVQERDALRRYNTLLQAALLPEPLPHSIQLSVTTESSAYFITEEDQGANGGASSSQAAEGLGLAAHVPRCLRWPVGSNVQLEAWTSSREATEQLVADLWRAKQTFDRTHARQHMLSFIYTYFVLLAPPPFGAGGVVAAASTRASDGASDSGAAASHEAAVRRCYSLFHACSCHAADSPSIQLLAAVLTGHLSEQAHADQQALLAGYLAALRALPPVSSPVEESVRPAVSVHHAQQTLEHLLPKAGQLQVHRLKTCLSSASPKDTVSLAVLESALFPPPASGSTPAGSDATSPSSVPPGATESVNEFAKALAAYHLDVLEAYGEQVELALQSNLATAEAGRAAGDRLVPLGRVVTALESLMPRDEAVARVAEAALGGASVGVQEDEGGAGSGQQGQAVAAAVMARLLRAFCLLRPAGTFDAAAAMAFAKTAKPESKPK